MIMQLSEMHTSFKHLIDKQSNYSAPEITPEEIDMYLNLSYHDLLTSLSKAGIEKNQDWVDYTRNITKSYNFIPYSNSLNKPHGVFIELPDDYRLALLEEVTIQCVSCHEQVTKRIGVRPITRDQYSKIIVDPFGKSWEEEVVKLSNSEGIIEVIGSPDITITKYYLDYIIEPEPIRYGTEYGVPLTNVDCQLEKKAAKELVYMAVNKAIQTLGDTRISLVQFDSLIKTI